MENERIMDPAATYKIAPEGDGVCVTGVERPGETLRIPEEIDGKPVISIGTSAFQGLKSVKAARLPGSLRSIGRCAFQGCTGLTAIELPGTLEALGESAFQGCAALSAVSLPEGLREIPGRAFYGCASLREIDIPSGVRRLGERAFAGCAALSRVRLPDGLEVIEHRAFQDCPSLKMLHVPASVTRLDATALPWAALPGGVCYLPAQAMLVRAEVKRHYALPTGTRILAGRALSRNESLLSVDFGDALEHIGPYALAECVCLKGIELPPGVREIGQGAFSDCERMTFATLSPSLRELPAEAFLRCRALTDVQLFPGIEAVGARAFEDCGALKVLSLPEGVRTIGERAFYRCASLERLALPASLRALGAGAISGCTNLRVLVLKGTFDGSLPPALSEARRAVIVAPKLPPEAFPGLWRKRVCLGYALAAKEGMTCAPGVADACLDWMRAHSTAFVADALWDVALMHLLVDGDCLSLEAVQALLDRAEGPDRDEYYASLLAYRNRRFGDASAGALKLW